MSERIATREGASPDGSTRGDGPSLRGLAALHERLPERLLASMPALLDRDEIGRLDRMLPRAFRDGCLECRLDGSQETFDLWATIPAEAPAMNACRVALAEPSWAASPGWEGLEAVLTHWSAAPSSDALGGPSRDLFLEFDLSRAGRQSAAAPIVVAMLAPADRHVAADRHARIVRYWEIVSGRGMGADLARDLGEVLSALGPSQHVRHVYVLTGRPSEELRLVITLRTPGVVPLLERLAWQGPLEHVAATLRATARHCLVVGLQIDVESHATGRVSVELHGSDADAWRRTLDHLQAQSVCTRAWRSAIEAWLDRGMDPPSRDLMIKLGFGPAGDISAKAYFIFT
ncbi:MAG TPA: hypothetical protein VLA56_21985 [Pseudomonadales bacterium]|nr:hypothetical protein [Pseudomonadales bacterium]